MQRVFSLQVWVYFTVSLYQSIRYDTIEEFNVDSKAEYTVHTRSHRPMRYGAPVTHSSTQ